MISVFPIPISSYYIIDSFPLAVCKFGCARYCKAFRGHEVDYGKCPSKKETYYGYKVLALIQTYTCIICGQTKIEQIKAAGKKNSKK